MKISLIGMSGTGKSYWSKKLEEKGFHRFGCDDLIEKKLEYGLQQLGYQGITDLAKWMRHPYEDRYSATSKIYLDYETRTMSEILLTLEKTSAEKNIIIDTTGSVIYLDKIILEKLKRLTKVVYLETPESVKEDMFKLFMREPKPVIWGDAFNKKPQETNIEALKRCYPEWLAYRTEHYKKLADITLDYFELRKPEFTVEQFLQKITI